MSLQDQRDRPIGPAIGWWLSGSLLQPVARALGAVVIAAGPWIVSVLALAIVSITITPILGHGAVEDLRLTVVYAFCIAPLVAGPVGAVLSRLIATELETGEPRTAPDLFLVAAIGSALVAELLAFVVVIALGIRPFEVAAAFIFLTGAAALLWTSFAALTALKAYRLLIGSFSTGMLVSVLLSLAATRGAIDTETLIWSFTAGITFSVAIALIRVRAIARPEPDGVLRAVRILLAELERLRVLVFGVFFAVVAVWADKWVAWMVPDAMTSNAGFLHFSPYDGVMFVAHLSAIPAYAALLLLHDTAIKDAMRQFHATLSDGSTYARIRDTISTFEQRIWSGIFSIVFLQAALAVCMVLAAPALAKILDFSFDQFVTLRVGVIAVFLHSFFFLSCAVLLVCNRIRVFLILQAGFAILNFTVSAGLYPSFGISAYAFFISALIMAVIAFFAAFRATLKPDYLIFMGENDTLFTR